MNGYLHNLTMRTLDLGNRVEPRLPSLFEAKKFERGPAVQEEDVQIEPYEEQASVVSKPALREISSDQTEAKTIAEPEKSVPEPPVAPTESNHDVAAKAIEALPERADLARPERANLALNEEPARSVTTVEKTVESEESRGLEEHSFVQPSSPSVESGEPATLPPRVHTSETKTPAVARTAKKGKAAIPAVVLRQPSKASDQLQSPPETTKQSPTETTKTVAPSHTEPDFEQVHDEAGILNSETAQPAKPYPRFTPAYPTWRNSREQQTHSRRRQMFGPVEPEPSINVTIGRVEVRAVQTDSKTAPRKSESPVMPLEEYLRKQRRGGER